MTPGISHKSIFSQSNIVRASFLITSILSIIQISFIGYSETYKQKGVRSETLRNRNPRVRKERTIPPQPVVYGKIQDVPKFLSSGPHEAIKGVPGLYEFRNVCVTRNIDDESLLGLVYFVPPNDTSVKRNPSRCVPCKIFLMHGWDDLGEDEAELGHKCGYHNLHAMYATSVSDWSECMEVQSKKDYIRTWWAKDPFSPPLLDTVHFYNDTVIALVNNNNIGHSLWDHMLAYLPYWFTFHTLDQFPFVGVASYSIENCLSDDTPQWYCSLLRAMDAFGGAPELNMVPRENSTVLNCFDKLLIPFLALPRLNDYTASKMPSKEVFDEFRQVIFDKLELPRPRNFRSQSNERISGKNVLFYAHAPSARRVWSNMNDLLTSARNNSKYKDWKFHSVYDFGTLSIQHQAYLFNTHDVMVMVHGAQMANSIFSPDGSMFIEVGCDIPQFLNEGNFLSLIGGRYGQVTSCGFDEEDSVCLECNRPERCDENSTDTDDEESYREEDCIDPIYSNFTMLPAKFDLLLESIDRLLPLNANVHMAQFIDLLAT